MFLCLSRSQYFISSTDDYTKKVWLYFLKFKDEAFQSFVVWKKMIETQSERKVKRLRTDNILESIDSLMDSAKSKELLGTERAHTRRKKKCIAERLNMTIMNKVHSMLSESGLVLKFWAEAAAVAVYLINRSPSSALEFKIPESCGHHMKHISAM